MKKLVILSITLFCFLQSCSKMGNSKEEDKIIEIYKLEKSHKFIDVSWEHNIMYITTLDTMTGDYYISSTSRRVIVKKP